MRQIFALIFPLKLSLYFLQIQSSSKVLDDSKLEDGPFGKIHTRQTFLTFPDEAVNCCLRNVLVSINGDNITFEHLANQVVNSLLQF
jgi:hypothetical protein